MIAGGASWWLVPGQLGFGWCADSGDRPGDGALLLDNGRLAQLPGVRNERALEGLELDRALRPEI